jgi:cytosine/uracil/thiamine/allantoin permease
MVALAAGVLVPLAGVTVPGAAFLFDGAWFSGALTAFAVHWLLMRRDPSLTNPIEEPR